MVCLAIEANGFGRGQGVLDISKTGFQKICMINPDLNFKRRCSRDNSIVFKN